MTGAAAAIASRIIAPMVHAGSIHALLRLLAAVAAAVVLSCAPAFAQGIGGSGEQAWFLWRVPVNETLLFRAAPEGEVGTVTFHSALNSAPAHAASHGDRLYLLYESTGEKAGHHPLRVLDAASIEGGAPLSAAASKSLDVSGQVLALGATALGPHALLFAAPSEVEPQGPQRVLVRALRERAWRDLAALPGARTDDRAMWNLVNSDRVEVIEAGEDPSRSTLLTHAPESDTWSSDAIQLPKAPRQFFRVHGSLISVTPEAEGDIVLHLLSDQPPIELARWGGVPADRAVLATSAGSGAVMAVWREQGLTGRFFCRAISPGGLVLFDGAARTPMPIGMRDVESILVLGAAGLMMIGVFSLRPGASAQGPAPVLPEGCTLAPASRRFFAGLIDLSIGLTASMLVMGVPFESLPAVLTLGRSVGAFPLALAVLVQVVLGGFGEAIFGRTIGKAVLGLRTVSFSGGSISPAQAAGRNMLKLLCPPLAIQSMITAEPTRTVNFRTMVVCRADTSAPSDSESGGHVEHADEGPHDPRG